MTGWTSDMTGPQACRHDESSQRRSTWPACVNQPARTGRTDGEGDGGHAAAPFWMVSDRASEPPEASSKV